MIVVMSMLITLIILFTINLVARVMISNSSSVVYHFFNSIEGKIGIVNAYYVVGFVLFVGIILLFCGSHIRYFVELNRTVRGIAESTSPGQLPVRGATELSELAENMNRLIAKMQQAVEEERRAELSKNELVTNVSHDLRTPLTSIIGYLGLIEQDRYRDEVELRHYVHIAYMKTERMRHLIEDLFEFTRERGSGLKLQKAPILIGELLRQLAYQYRPEAERAGMEIRLLEIEDRLSTQADGTKLMRVFENLIVNAMHYGREGKFVDLTARRDGHFIAIEVINYGNPIPGTDLPHIFERFYRVERSRSENTGGTGLGLAIAKSIVDRHDGMIRAYSDERLTSFEVRLPAG